MVDRELIRDYFESYEEATLMELHEAFGVDKWEILGILTNMINDGEVERELKKGNYHYYLAKKPFNWKYLLILLAVWSMRFQPFALIKLILG